MDGRNPFTDEEKAELARLHGEGRSCRQIAESLDRSTATISRYAKELGLEFDREQTANATRAHVLDAKAARAALISWQYNRCLRLAERLDAGTFKVAGQTQFGLQAEVFDFVPDGSELNLSRAMSQYAKTAADLEKIDAGSDAQTAKSMLLGIADGLKSMYEAAGMGAAEQSAEDAAAE